MLFIRVQNKADVWSLYDVVSFGVDSLLDVEKVLANEFSIYPNPIKETLTINTAHQLETYKIYNAAGVKVSSGNFSSNTIPVSQLPSGIYFCVITSDKGTVVKKLVKE